ncbi:5-(carboxyamino)imidazole ribonucleotide synthase [Aestuariirhabdus sp. Z084]|uniref:5-(carboxyamino)imidazole ribonucleotide synthase n=1 Tax=Aestuariirhabdus haliotis TaxID=2918751 RepID=UPI00201B35A1|nr:5-(carboxyamino)imidazole ribonucleotide synthase [Aestuariirhabdus haliotis]MCL6414103.1 5-(carboxyamino)imidazole ribonucleotide synthase [Aestuariirhabdus haliotis]MCL6418035.1 5-(carboxyamino)imidazole ribonucleotide synthase [Aestuariirhabdus haliotis]
MMHIAIIGGGQLARMMALAGWPMGITFSFLANKDENIDCVHGLGTVVRHQSDVAGEALYQALGQPDVITVEREHVDVNLLATLRPFCAVYPDPDAIAVCQHRGREKAFLQSLDIPIAPFRLADSADTLSAAVAELGYPVFVKSCEEGYDGQNQWRLTASDELVALIEQMEHWPSLVVEGQVTFSREVSIIAVRSANGAKACYPLAENAHRSSILVSSLAPAPNLTEALQQQAQQLADRLLDCWGYVGVLAIECFVVGDRLLVNELAPRVHNSGHWTQDAGGVCSQFANHLRAICGKEPGPTEPLQPAAMLNLLGQLPSVETAGKGELQLHLYNKLVKPRRKVGHINLQDSDPERLRQRLEALEAEVYQATGGAFAG